MYLFSILRGREPLCSGLLGSLEQCDLRFILFFGEMCRDGRDDGVYALERRDETGVVRVVDCSDVDASGGEGWFGSAGEKNDGVFL